MENKRKIPMYITLKQLNKSNNVKTKLIQIKKFELQFSVHWPYSYNPGLLHNLNNLNTLIPFLLTVTLLYSPPQSLKKEKKKLD